MLKFLTFLLLSFQAGAITSTQSNSVMITDTKRTYGGSGFYVLTELGHSYILTNAHVCGDQYYQLITPQDGPIFQSNVVFKNKDVDLCAIKPIHPHKGFHLAKNPPFCGEYVIFMGYPELQPFTVQVTEHCDEVLLTTVKHGNSGSPVLNLDLEVVGVVEAMFKDSEDGMFIFWENVKKFLEGK